MRRAAALGLVVCALITAALTAAPTAGAATPKHARRPLEFAVGVTTQRFDNEGRSISATVYYPATGRAAPFVIDDAPRNTKWAPYPLILFSDELGSNANDYAALLRAWASNGYVVAVPDYPQPSTTDTNADGQVSVDLGERVVDASFVIDRMLDEVQGGFGHLVDHKKIVAAGHALGAIVTFVLAYGTGIRDPRIEAAVTMAGSLAGDPTNYFADVNTPLLAIHGDADKIDPIAGTKSAYALASPPKFYVTLLGADHSAPYISPTDAGFPVVKETTLDFFSAYVGGRVSGLQQLERDGNVPKVSKITSNPE
ncbi:MAG TPA: dienelactone hydrolase family protein [Acidimicrobiia bacterium]|nr:dienelactone hydrolase family protein [Acidimicrobiia bacterium]